MCNELSSKNLEVVEEPFKDCYSDPIFELDENGEIVDYAVHPEDFRLDEFHVVGNPELEL